MNETQPTPLLNHHKSTQEDPIMREANFAAARLFAQFAVDIAQTSVQREQEHAKERAALESRAEHDSLTGLYNREHLITLLTRKIEGRQPFGLIGIDLDRFKDINDRLGHATGDRVLQAVGSFLKSHFIRSEDIVFRPETAKNGGTEENTVARMGGDEFVIVVGLNGPRISNDQRAQTPNERMQRELSYLRTAEAEFVAKAPKLHGLERLKDIDNFGMSVGYSIWTPDSVHTDVEQVLDEADRAMYADKELRKSHR